MKNSALRQREGQRTNAGIFSFEALCVFSYIQSFAKDKPFYSIIKNKRNAALRKNKLSPYVYF